MSEPVIIRWLSSRERAGRFFLAQCPECAGGRIIARAALSDGVRAATDRVKCSVFVHFSAFHPETEFLFDFDPGRSPEFSEQIWGGP